MAENAENGKPKTDLRFLGKLHACVKFGDCIAETDLFAALILCFNPLLCLDLNGTKPSNHCEKNG